MPARRAGDARHDRGRGRRRERRAGDRPCRCRVRASAYRTRRHDAHQGGLSDGEGAQPDRLRRPPLQLPRRRIERGRVQRRSRRTRRFPGRAGLHARPLSRCADVGRRDVVRLLCRPHCRRAGSAGHDAHRHRAAGVALRLRRRRGERESEVLHPRRIRRARSAEGNARVLRALRRTEGSRRHRRGRSSVRGESEPGRRGDRGFVRRLVMKDAVIVSAVRTAVGKAPGGTLRGTRPDELAAAAIGEALKRANGIDAAEIDDVILGCAMPEAEQGMNVARIASLRAGIPVSASAVTVNRFCSSGLQAIAYAAERIMVGSASVIVAGGTESMSLVPMGGHKIAPNPTLIDRYPDVYLSTGLVAENHARESGISRAEQDAFALRSHHRALAAIESGRFADEIVPVTANLLDDVRQNAGPTYRPESDPTYDRADPTYAKADGRRGGTAVAAAPRTRQVIFSVDEGPRRDTSLEALARLRPAFHAAGSVTAGNSSQTSDGASAVVITSAERARDAGLAPLGRFVAFATAGVEPERFGIGPVPAIRKALKLAGLTLDQIDLIELNEAFAAQVLACLKELPIDLERLNVNGGAIALGHPLGCTGAKLTTTLLYEMKRRKARYGMVTMCVGGGMGAAGIFERI